MTDIVVGFNGHCKDHPTMGVVIRPAPPVGSTRIHTARAQHSPCGRTMFGRVQELHCAAGHMYQFIDVSEMIHDPFTEDEDITISMDESWKIINGQGGS